MWSLGLNAFNCQVARVDLSKGASADSLFVQGLHYNEGYGLLVFK
jgi:hypothetical protein